MKRPLALIPARKGSKGLPGKNTRMFAGKPLIAHTIEAAIASNCVDVFVSTDDEEVISIARSYNLTADYVRPSHLANDQADMADVARDALTWRQQRGTQDSAICLLQPTSPLRTSRDIIDAVNLYHQSSDLAVFGVSHMWTHPSVCIRLSGRKSDLIPTSWQYLVEPGESTRRQDYNDDYFFINGAIYITSVSQLQTSGNFITPESVPFVMDPTNTIDIDNSRDFLVAEALFRSIKKLDEQEHQTTSTQNFRLNG